MPDDPIVKFYRHEAADDRGRTLHEIWIWDQDRLERVHDFIQWLFPLREPSLVNSSAPVATDATVAAFAADAALRDALRQSFELMMDFYGLVVEPLDAGHIRVRVVRGGNFDRRSRTWVTPHNHNHLRLTRILASVRMLGLPGHSDALFEQLRDVYDARRDAISTVTYGYWQRAAAGD